MSGLGEKSLESHLHPSKVAHHLFVAKTHHLKTIALQNFSSRLVPRLRLRLQVIRPIHLNDKLEFGAVEVGDKVVYRALPVSLCQMLWMRVQAARSSLMPSTNLTL